MTLSLILAFLAIGYAAFVLIRRARRGKCFDCPYAGDCSRCEKKPREKI